MLALNKTVYFSFIHYVTNTLFLTDAVSITDVTWQLRPTAFTPSNGTPIQPQSDPYIAAATKHDVPYEPINVTHVPPCYVTLHASIHQHPTILPYDVTNAQYGITPRLPSHPPRKETQWRS